MNALEEARLVRRRKDRTARHLHVADSELGEILFIHPCDTPLYLDHDQVWLLKRMRETINEVLERHTEDLKKLEQECQQTAKPAT